MRESRGRSVCVSRAFVRADSCEMKVRPRVPLHHARRTTVGVESWKSVPVGVETISMRCSGEMSYRVDRRSRRDSAMASRGSGGWDAVDGSASQSEQSAVGRGAQPPPMAKSVDKRSEGKTPPSKSKLYTVPVFSLQLIVQWVIRSERGHVARAVQHRKGFTRQRPPSRSVKRW